MEQKLYHLYLPATRGEVITFPQDLEELLENEWKIVKVSAYGFGTARGGSGHYCVMLLQRGE